MSNIGLDNVKDVMSNIGLDTDKMKPTENSNKLVSDLMSDLKTSLKVETTNGKVDSKQFVDNLMNVGNTLGNTYSKKLSSGELSFNDIIGAVTSITTGDTNPLNDFAGLELDKLDMNEVLGELKNKMSDKIPSEFLDTFNNLQNVDVSSLINLMGSGSDSTAVKELTLEQKKELEKYYEDLKL
jgi:acyl carrier protein